MVEDLTAARLIAGGIFSGAVVLGALRFVRWAVEFACGRLDMRIDRVGKRERDYEAKIEDRLNQLEQEVALYRRATVVLNGALARIDPGNAALGEVATILARGYAVKDQDLIDKLKDVP